MSKNPQSVTYTYWFSRAVVEVLKTFWFIICPYYPMDWFENVRINSYLCASALISVCNRACKKCGETVKLARVQSAELIFLFNREETDVIQNHFRLRLLNWCFYCCTTAVATVLTAAAYELNGHTLTAAKVRRTVQVSQGPIDEFWISMCFCHRRLCV
jgi:hypothetical protein